MLLRDLVVRAAVCLLEVRGVDDDGDAASEKAVDEDVDGREEAAVLTLAVLRFGIDDAAERVARG